MNGLLPSDAGGVLLPIARHAIGRQLRLAMQRPPRAPWLDDKRASFVTLMSDGKLRGCIGSLLAKRKLGGDVRHNARAAAFRDARFRALTAAEFPGVHLEVSVLTEPEPLHFTDRDGAVEQLRPKVDGVILTCNGKRATFLPQVWQHLPDREQFIGELLRKAGLAPDHWGSGVQLARYQVQVFAEPTQ